VQRLKGVAGKHSGTAVTAIREADVRGLISRAVVLSVYYV
jgi:hypothetical protein